MSMTGWASSRSRSRSFADVGEPRSSDHSIDGSNINVQLSLKKLHFQFDQSGVVFLLGDSAGEILLLEFQQLLLLVHRLLAQVCYCLGED